MNEKRTTEEKADVLVVGGGPGGYVAAIRAADLGRNVTLLEQHNRCGGVCLLEGCIPSKALIHAVEVIDSAKEAHRIGVTFEGLSVDRQALRQSAERVISDLSRGIDTLLKKRGVTVIRGRGRLAGPNLVEVTDGPVDAIRFDHCILATGSRVTQLPLWKGLDVWTSSEALELRSIPQRLLVVGGGYIGLELGFVYAGLGSKVVVVEMLPDLLSGADPDLALPIARRCKKKFEEVLLNTKLSSLTRDGDMFVAELTAPEGNRIESFDQVLVSVGRTPNTDDIGLDRVGIKTDKRKMIVVDEQQRTSVPHIFAIGDIVPGPGLAHKASREGKVAAEAISGKPSAFDNVSIPAVVFTDPELAWTGLTEQQAKAQNIAITVGRFPHSALGRARTLGRTEGMVKVIADAETKRILGVGIVGPHASELISEAALALELGAVLEDLTATIHPHPTLAEAMAEAAEVAEGTAVHVLPQKR